MQHAKRPNKSATCTLKEITTSSIEVLTTHHRLVVNQYRLVNQSARYDIKLVKITLY